MHTFGSSTFIIQTYIISPSCIDEESEDEDAFGEATHALAKAAHDTASVCSDPLTSYRAPTDSLDGRRGSFSLSRLPKY